MKTKTIFLFAIITLLLVFSGCSEKSNIPSIYDETNIGIKSLEIEENYIFSEYSYKYIEILMSENEEYESINDLNRSEDKEYQELNLLQSGMNFSVTAIDLIDILIESIKREGYSFKNYNIGKTMINKLEALKKIVFLDKKQPALNKIVEDILPFSEKWIETNDIRGMSSVGYMLEVIHFIVLNNITEINIFYCTQCKSWFWQGKWYCVEKIVATLGVPPFSISIHLKEP